MFMLTFYCIGNRRIVMFGYYILVISDSPDEPGRFAEFECVSRLMDRDLLAESLRAMVYDRNSTPCWDMIHGTQWIWEDYCARHAKKYGEEYRPDIDEPSSPDPAKMAKFYCDFAELVRLFGKWPKGAVGVSDFDRASHRIDHNLLAASLRAMLRERNTSPRQDTKYGAQWVWDYYCARHAEKYGRPFPPDVDPACDRPEITAPAECRLGNTAREDAALRAEFDAFIAEYDYDEVDRRFETWIRKTIASNTADGLAILIRHYRSA
jgi:hypothetical protein